MNILSIINKLRDQQLNEILKNDISLYSGSAHFIDNHTVEVDNTFLTSSHILIATGLKPSRPEIINSRKYGITTDNIFSMSVNLI